MVRTRGNFLSHITTGTLADAITAATTRGRSYLRHRPRPTKPPTQTQLAYRYLMSWCCKAWSHCTKVERATWNERALQLALPPYHTFLRENYRTLSSRHGATKTYGATPGSTALTYDSASAEAGRHFCKLGIQIGARPWIWGVLWYRKEGGTYTEHPNYAIGLVFPSPNTWVYLYDWTAKAGVTYTYRKSMLADDGRISFGHATNVLTPTD